MNIKYYLDLPGLTSYDAKLKNYIKDLKDVEAYNSLTDFPKVGKEATLYLASSSKVLYAWSAQGYYRIGLDEELINKIDVAYNNAKIAKEHAEIKDGSNPHKTTYNNIIDIPNVATLADLDFIINKK